MTHSKRQLAAIMFTDIVGYTSLMDKDEDAAFAMLERNRAIHKERIEQYNGIFLKEMGDGILASFNTVSDAVFCAGLIQQACEQETHLNLRIGIHQGEIVNQGKDVFGSGVNIASRIQAIAPEGGIWVSDSVQRNIQNKKGIEIKFVKEEALKNVNQPVRIYDVNVDCKSLVEDFKAIDSTMDSKIKTNLKSIAVLPFANMSSDPEQDFFCEGISEEIINTIVQLPDLKVAGRTSCFSFKGKNEDLRLIGLQLGVNNILEGSVRKSGNRVRITAQLIEVSTGFHLWSHKYDRELIDVFEIQDEIALEIANQLEVSLLGKKPMPKSREQTQSIEAYQLYCKGRSLFYERGMSLFEALKCFQSALGIDPNYALASSGLSDTYIMLCFHGYSSPSDCWAKAVPASQKAFKYGPDLAETHNTLAVISLLHDRNLEEAEREFKKALALNPLNIQARVWYALFYLTFALKNFKKGIEQSIIAIENDPLSSYAFACYGLVLAAANKNQEAIKLSKSAVELDQNSMLARYTLSHCYLCSGQLEKALQECIIALDASNRHAWNLNLIATIYMEMGRTTEALRIYEELERGYHDHNLPPSQLAIAAATLGKDKLALELAHSAVDIFDPYLPYKGVNFRSYKAIREIPGINQVLSRLGYSKKRIEMFQKEV